MFTADGIKQISFLLFLARAALFGTSGKFIFFASDGVTVVSAEINRVASGHA
jgi:hypothetical protein